MSLSVSGSLENGLAKRKTPEGNKNRKKVKIETEAEKCEERNVR
jgi:hypothetical protein